VVLGADGAEAGLITISRENALIRMNGHDTFNHAVTRMSESTAAACSAEGLTLDDIDLFVFHQANARILTGIAERLSLPDEKLVHAIADIGNTSAGSVPIALDLARRNGQLRQGDIVLLAAFGAGLTWSAAVIEWGRS
jgi:3-oxoacyl-[acyl-carrier-protein] synthase-3